MSIHLGKCDHGWRVLEKVVGTKEDRGITFEVVEEWANESCSLCKQGEPIRVYGRPVEVTLAAPQDPTPTQTRLVVDQAALTSLENVQFTEAFKAKVWEAGVDKVLAAKQESEHEVIHQTTKVLDQARALICGDRAASYGCPKEQYEHLARAWCAYLRLPSDFIDARDVLQMFGIAKAGRDRFKRKRDNVVDGAGYQQLAGWVGDPRDGAAPPSVQVEVQEDDGDPVEGTGAWGGT